MDIILDVIVAVIGIAVFFIPLFLWNKRFGKTSISIATVKKRKQYKKVATLGFLLLVVVGIDFMTMDSDYSSSLALYIIVGYIFASSRICFEPYYDSSVVKELGKREYCLFLRPFDSDGRINLKSRLGLKSKSLEDTFCEELCKSVAQTYAVGNPNWCLPSNKNSINIYATDEEWHQMVDTLSDGACVILLKVGNTPACKWEIENLSKHTMFDKVMAIVENEDAYEVAKEYMNVSLNVSDTTFPFVTWYEANEASWQNKHIQTKKDVKLALSAFIKSQEEVKHQIQENKNQVKLSNLIQKKNIPARWYVILEAFINPFALLMVNHWPKRWAYSFGGIYALFIIIWIEVLPETFSSDLFIVGVLCLIILIPFLFLAPRVSRYSYSWGSDAVFKTINKELCVWLLLFSLFLFLLHLTLAILMTYW